MKRWYVARPPISFSPDLWEHAYKGFWQAWLSGRREIALLRLGDWRQP